MWWSFSPLLHLCAVEAALGRPGAAVGFPIDRDVFVGEARIEILTIHAEHPDVPLLSLAVGRVVPLLAGVVVRLFQRPESLLEIIAGAADRLVLDDVNVIKLRPFVRVSAPAVVLLAGTLTDPAISEII